MAQEEKEKTAIINAAPEGNQESEGENDPDLSPVDRELPTPLTVSSRVLFLLGDITAGPAYRFTQWLELVRERSARHPSSSFPKHLSRLEAMPSSAGESVADSKHSVPCNEGPDITLWERLGKAAMLDIESSEFSWDMLASLHHTGYSNSAEQAEDETNKALEVTVNSGGIVFFALFNRPDNCDLVTKEAAAVIKISSSRMATQSERLGYEFAKWLGVRTPQARVIHSSNPEWQLIKDAAEKARDIALSERDEVGEVTCSELLEALELSRYVHGSPLLQSADAFDCQEAAERTAAALGGILMLDLVIRNEDRLSCRHLGWRGNSANLLFTDTATFSNLDAWEEAFDSANRRYRPRVIRALQKERRVKSADVKLSPHNHELISQSSDVSDLMDSPNSSNMSLISPFSAEAKFSDMHIVAIDSGIPRRPPAGKRANDQGNYPKLVELLLNSAEYSSSLLYEITGAKLGSPLSDEADAPTDSSYSDTTTIVHEFRRGFRAALRDLQGFHIFLLTLHQKLDSLLRVFLAIMNKSSSGDFDRDDSGVPESPGSKEQSNNEIPADLTDLESQRTALRTSTPGYKENDCASSISREGWHGKFGKGSVDPLHSLRLTVKFRDFNKFAKFDAELNKELEHWNELLRTDAIRLCQDNNFNPGFFEGSDTNSVVDAYELKVRLEHILERIMMISDAANTEKPSSITYNLFIGGALAARSAYTLQHLGITHILCLCSNEIGQSDSQYHDLFEYKNFSISDNVDTNISSIFEEASYFIDHVEQSAGRVLVHCFEGKSRSATVVLAYLMLRKNFTLSEAWNLLKRAHRRAQPNDGFAKMLLDLDKKLHGKVSMEWQRRRPMMRVCPICEKNVGLSSSSLKLHLQKAHRKLSSGSVDSAMSMEIQKVLNTLKFSRSGSVSQREGQSNSEAVPFNG